MGALFLGGVWILVLEIELQNNANKFYLWLKNNFGLM